MRLARVSKAPEVLRYGMVGVFNTVLGVSLMVLMSHTGWPYPVYTTLVYLAVFSISFALNRTFTFGVRDRWKHRMGRFFAFNGANMLLAQAVQAVLIEGLSTSEDIAVGTGMALYIVIGYFGNKHYVFKAKDMA